MFNKIYKKLFNSIKKVHFSFFNKKKIFPAKVSRVLFNIIRSNISKIDKILEVGCSSAHISCILKQLGYNIKGIEIRSDIAKETIEKFKTSINFEIIIGNILNHNCKYDVIWSSGLLQCLNDEDKKLFIQHFIKIAPKGIFFVPERKTYLPSINIENAKIGVFGCEEFSTDNIKEILFLYYKNVKMNILQSKQLDIDINFICYICDNN